MQLAGVQLRAVVGEGAICAVAEAGISALVAVISIMPAQY
jgi:hypothetical protein